MYTEEQARELVIQAGLELVEKGLVARTWGNVSARCGENEFIITPSGIAYDILKAEDLVKVNAEGLSYEGDIKPSSEKGIHASVYMMREDANFVIHTHQQYASVVAAEEKDVEFAACAGYGLPGTDALKKQVVKALEENEESKSFLLAKHGALLIGESMEEAFELADSLEDECKNLVEKRIPIIDPDNLGTVDLDLFRNSGRTCAVLVQNKFVAECCRAGINVKPYLDDFAQMIGPNMHIVDCKLGDIEKALIGRNAVCVRGVGAVCVGSSEDDCEAAASIVTKNCAAACYVRNAQPLSLPDALLQRYIYVSKYSKKKNG